MTKINFKKYSANGNDFIIVGDLSVSLVPAQIKLMCDRRFGIGADGVLVYKPLSGFDGEMQILNSDGYEASMCGNGLRALVTYLAEQTSKPKNSYLIKTKAGDYQVNQKNESFYVQMLWTAQDQNFVAPLNDFDKIFFVSTGVPHLVFLCDDVKAIDIVPVARKYRFHSLFPEGTNVNFVQVLDDDKKTALVRTYERGVEDETFSCGTGLTACALALEHWKNWQGTLNLKTKGGDHFLTLGEKVEFGGEVKFCFAGEYHL